MPAPVPQFPPALLLGACSPGSASFRVAPDPAGAWSAGGACSAGIVNPEFASFARHTASWFPAGSGPAPRGPSLHAPAHQCIVSPARPSRPCGSRPCSPPLWAPPPRLPLLLDLVMLAAVMTKPQAIWMQAAGISRVTGAIVPSAQGTGRTMTAVVSALSTRIKYVQSLRLHTTEEELRKIMTVTEGNIEQCIDKYPYTISVATATALIELLSEDTTLFSDRFRRLIIEKVNSRLGTEPDNANLSHNANLSLNGKQTMMYPENYFTDHIWNGIMDGESSQHDIYMHIVAVLVRLGLSRPQETFWGILVATIQWGSNNPNFEAAHVRDVMKRMWKSLRFIIPTAPDAPTEYPTLPCKLLDTHPELYHRAYPGRDQPVPPPRHLEVLRLSWLRSTTGSRCTKKSLIECVSKQWHVIALETTLVFGNRVNATRITRRGPCGA